jgi:hypothetical protein
VERIHIASDGKREWLFEQNARDARRISGWLTDHVHHVIIRYEESDLRIAMGLRGWVDMLALGFDPAQLHGLVATGDVRSVDGLAFVRYASPAGIERWWNAHHLLPIHVTTSDGRGTSTLHVVRIRRGVDQALLEIPARRFADYRVVDLAEWLERH